MYFYKSMSLLIFCFYLSFNFSFAQASESSFTKEQIQEDLAFLKLNLEKYHPNLYLYSDKKSLDGYFENLGNYVVDPINSAESFKLISSTSAVIMDGHYTLSPDATILSNFYTNSMLLPLDIFWVEMDAYLIRNFTDSQELKIGERIFSINGVPIENIQKVILTNVLRDGNNKTYPMWILNTFLRAYYGFYFGSPEDYVIEIGPEANNTQMIQIKGLSHSEIKQAKKNKYPAYDKIEETKQGLSLSMDPKLKLARLTIRSFDKKILKNEYQQKFKPVLRGFMQEINDADIEHLVIDIRDNQGGEVSNGIFLLKHLLDQPFTAVIRHAKVDKNNYNNLSERTKKANSSVDGIQKPFTKNNYRKQLYLLTNGGSFSCSGIFAQALKSQNRGTFIGQETGGSAYNLVGLPTKDITLPHTKIMVNIPRVQFVLQEITPKKGSGVIPDIRTEISIENILENRDIEYQEVLDLIKK